MFPSLIQDGVISAHTDVCIACGATEDFDY